MVSQGTGGTPVDVWIRKWTNSRYTNAMNDRIETTGSQKIKNPLSTNPQLAQILEKSGFIVTDADVIVKNGSQLVLRKRINGENPDGSPKYYDVPISLSGADLAVASNAFTAVVDEATSVVDETGPVAPISENGDADSAIPDDESLIKTEQEPLTLDEVAARLPEEAISEDITPTLDDAIAAPARVESSPETKDEHVPSAQIAGKEVLVGQVLATAAHIVVLDLLKKTDGVHAILLNMQTGGTLDIAIPVLETIGSLPELEALFS